MVNNSTINSSVVSFGILLSLSIGLLFYGVEFDLFFLLLFITTAIMSYEFGDLVLGKRDIFDPAVFVSFFSYVFFLLSPLLQRNWAFWPSFPMLHYYDDWMLVWALASLIGALFYRSLMVHYSKYNFKRSNYVTVFNNNRFMIFVFFSLLIGFVFQLYIYSSFGGVTGFVEVFSERQQGGVSDYDPFDGLGVPMLFADGARNVFAIWLIVYFRDKPYAKNLMFFLLALFLLVSVNVFFGGLKGSRGAILYSAFWGVGMYHFWIRPITLKGFIVGVFSGFIFLNTYYWYKFSGAEGISAIWDDEIKVSLNQGLREDNLKFVLSRDLGRMDFQTLAFKAVFDEGYDYSLGRSYFSSIFSVIPAKLVPVAMQLPTVTKEKTEILYGRGSYIHGEPRATTNLLGQMGELVINFGVLGVPLFFGLLAIYVRRVQSIIYTKNSRDVFLLLCPMLSLLAIHWFMYDSSVFAQFVLRNFIYVIPIYLFCLRRVKLI